MNIPEVRDSAGLSSEYVGGVLARSKPPISCLLLKGVTNVARNENT